jgi:phosphoribosylformylglycinamidine synthase subunit PurS
LCCDSTSQAPGMVKRCERTRVPMVTQVTNRHTEALKQRLPGAWLARRLRPGGLAYAAVVPKVVIDVMLKPEIHDPQGDAIASACRRLGFGQVAAVRQGKRFELELTEPASVDRMAELAAELLANPVIEDFSIEPM